MYSVQCGNCQRKFPGKPGCKAFVRIPFEILMGKADHRKPYPGDNGIRFEPVKEKK